MNEQFKEDFKTILDEPNELSDDVTYVRYDDDSRHSLRAIIDLREFASDQSEGRIEVDVAVCYLALPFEPEKRDKVRYGDAEYDVMDWVKTPYQYKLMLKMNAHLTGTHIKSRYR